MRIHEEGNYLEIRKDGAFARVRISDGLTEFTDGYDTGAPMEFARDLGGWIDVLTWVKSQPWPNWTRP